eukprot:TRINITY_DN7820_c0_g1_i2.p1 TRINITY_DN7820_c0_g1~~TRINITY_DN7820_c0_g1_i2.p1  ORF type:complete len:771 (+),score=167.12 TRINITY_DN7820_c0_g1_i2:291-2315(+)
MDVDPCEDFYQFACGNFIDNAVIPDHKSKVGAFSTVRDKLNERLKKLFEGKGEENEPPVFKSVRSLYKSCMNLDYIEEKSRSEVLEVVSKMGGWPVLGDAFDPEQFVWYELMDRASRLGYGTGKLVSVGISTDADNSTKRIMEIDQASLGLEREYLVKGFDDKDVQAYYRYMVDAAMYLGAEKEAAESQLKDSLMFEIDLANLTMKREERRNKTALNNKRRLGDVKELYDIDWVRIVNEVLENSELVSVDENEIVNVATPKYIQDVKELIGNTDPKIVANYMMWRFVKGSFGFLAEEARDITLEYKKVLAGTKQQPPRWETCVKATAGIGGSYLYWYEGSLTNAVGSMYARKYFPLENKNIADEMVKYIRKEFKIMLDELDWMDQETRERAHTKVDTMTPFIAYAKEILDDNLLNEFYSGLEMNEDSYLNNYLALKRFINKYYIKTFRDPIDKKSWKTHGGAAIVNAFYSPNENSIQFPAGILDGLFFQADRPSYMNYGAIGMVVGHEITHGFDDQGSQRDGEGNLRDWWESDTKNNYLEKTKCIIEQYGNFTVEVDGETLNLNGVNTQGENIADNGGYKEAIRAYERLTAEHGKEPKLPGLPYNQRQLFWLSGASIWCDATRPATLKNRVLTDPHSPGRFRVNGPYSNLKEFAADWQCQKGTRMNPDHKCSVW